MQAGSGDPSPENGIDKGRKGFPNMFLLVSCCFIGLELLTDKIQECGASGLQPLLVNQTTISSQEFIVH